MDTSELKKDVKHLLYIIHASQYALPITIRYFRVSAIYLMLANIAKWIARFYLYNQIELSGGFLGNTLDHKLIECCIRIVILIPIIIITLYYKRKSKEGNYNDSMLLFELAALTMITYCVAAVVSSATIINNSYADFLMVVCAGICMYLSGALLHDRKIKLCAFWFSAVSAIILIAAGITLTTLLSDPSILNDSYHAISVLCSYATGAVYYIFVPAGFFILSVLLGRIKKQGELS